MATDAGSAPGPDPDERASVPPGTAPSDTAPPGTAPPFTAPSDAAPPDTAPSSTARPAAAPPGDARRARTRWPTSARLTVGLLGVALAASLGAGALVTSRLLDTNQRWQDSSTQWEALAREHGAQAAEAISKAEQLQADLDETERQLATAKKRITALADEKAKAGDKAATSQERSDYQSRVSQAATDVATALGRCIDGQHQLLTYVEHAEQYAAADVERYGDDVHALCTAATDANDALQTALGS